MVELAKMARAGDTFGKLRRPTPKGGGRFADVPLLGQSPVQTIKLLRAGSGIGQARREGEAEIT